MGNFRFSNLFSNCVTCGIAGVILLSNLAPVNSYAAQAVNVNVNDVAFIARLQKLIEKIKSCKKSSTIRKFLM